MDTLSDLVTETPKFLTSHNAVEKPYEAPHARVSSIEDSCTVYSEYSQAPAPSVHSNETEQEPVRVLVPEKKINEASEKSQTKESASKGIRKLLKFGKKSQSSSASEHHTESNNAAVNSNEDHEPAVTAATASEGKNFLHPFILIINYCRSKCILRVSCAGSICSNIKLTLSYKSKQLLFRTNVVLLILNTWCRIEDMIIMTSVS